MCHRVANKYEDFLARMWVRWAELGGGDNENLAHVDSNRIGALRGWQFFTIPLLVRP